MRFLCDQCKAKYQIADEKAANKLSQVDQRRILGGEPPSPVDPPAGCRFNPRCWMATDECREIVPPLHALSGPGIPLRDVACHHAEEAVLAG